MQQACARTTDALPVVSFPVDNPFSPLTLRPDHFESSIVNHPDFAAAYQIGFESFGEECEGGLDVSTEIEVRSILWSNVCRSYDDIEAFHGVTSLAFRAGFSLGWLFGLAGSCRDLATDGLEFLSVLVALQYRQEVSRGFNPLVAQPGMYRRSA